MKNLPLFDLHCDTASAAYSSGKSLISNDLHLSFERLTNYSPFCQTLAIWSSHHLDCEAAWNNFFTVKDFICSELKKTDRVRLVTNDAELRACEKSGVGAVILAVEGGKIIGDDLSRLDILRNNGVRFLTLTWNDPCPICGSLASPNGLSQFGAEVVKHAHRIGIIPDISHASMQSAEDVIAICEESKKPLIATHSNSRTVLFHDRNLTDSIFTKMAKLGALVGISMAPQHLAPDGGASIETVVRHIEHYMSLGGEDTVCLGCDFDGIETTPDGIERVSDLYKIADALGRINYTDQLIEKIFYANARNFISLWLN